MARNLCFYYLRQGGYVLGGGLRSSSAFLIVTCIA